MKIESYEPHLMKYYLDFIPDEVKDYIEKFNITIDDRPEHLKFELCKRLMEDCDSIVVKGKTHEGEIKYVNIFVGSKENVLHEIGHIFDIRGREEYFLSSSNWFRLVYEKECAVAGYDEYLSSDATEYFAESFVDYCLDNELMKSKRPHTHAFISQAIRSLSYSDEDAAKLFNVKEALE